MIHSQKDDDETTLLSSLASSSLSLSSPLPSSSSPSPPSLLAQTKRCEYCQKSIQKALLCSRCRLPYCSPACQKKDWKLHRTRCTPVTSIQQVDRHLPELPLEVLERILRYTFFRRTPTTPSSDPYPLRNTTHLLLVSKAFRELCLPIFFHSVTLARPSDYITFFDPENGLFSGGEHGRKRWDYVKEFCVVADVRPPSLVTYSDMGMPTFLVRLETPARSPRNPLDLVCILEPRSPFSPPEKDPDVRRLLSSARKDALRLRAVIQESVETEFQGAVEMMFGNEETLALSAAVVFPREVEEGVVQTLDETVLGWIQEERKAALGQFLRAGRPRQLVLSADGSSLYSEKEVGQFSESESHWTDEAESPLSGCTIVVHRSSRRLENTQISPIFLSRALVHGRLRGFVGQKKVRLVGFSEEFVNSFTSELETGQTSATEGEAGRWRFEGEVEGDARFLFEEGDEGR